MITIYGRASSANVRKVLWAADLMGLPYMREDWGRGFRSVDEPEFRAMNPFGLVPVLRDGNLVIRESHTILRYLAASAGRTDLLPADPGGRAMVEQWMDWVIAELNPSWQAAFKALILKVNVAGGDEAVAASRKAWSGNMELLDGELARTGAYLLGDALSLADIPMGVAVNRWFAVPMERPDLPAVAAYYERLSQAEPYRRHVRNGLP